jgi:quercetin dioxygenase-like cupin family protein
VTDRAPEDGLISIAADQGVVPLAIAPETFLKARADWTDGAVCATGSVLRPGAIVPAHVHDTDAQVTIVISGRLGTWVDGEAGVLGAGGYAHRPAGRPHSIFNPFDEPARFLELTTPGERFERYMLALSDLHERGEATPAAIAPLAAAAGISVVEVDLSHLLEEFGPGGGERGDA